MKYDLTYRWKSSNESDDSADVHSQDFWCGNTDYPSRREHNISRFHRKFLVLHDEGKSKNEYECRSSGIQQADLIRAGSSS